MGIQLLEKKTRKAMRKGTLTQQIKETGVDFAPKLIKKTGKHKNIHK